MHYHCVSVCVYDYSECARCLCTLVLNSRTNTHTQPLSHSLTHTHTESAAPTNWTKSRLLAPTAEHGSGPCALFLSLYLLPLPTLSRLPLPLLSVCAVLLPLHSSACELNELKRLCQCLFNERRQRTWQRLRQRQRSRVDPSWMSLKWRSLCKYWRGKELEERGRRNSLHVCLGCTKLARSY